MLQFLTLFFFIFVAIFNPVTCCRSKSPEPTPYNMDNDLRKIETVFGQHISQGSLRVPTHEEIQKCLKRKKDSVYCSNIDNYPPNEYLEALVREKFPHLKGLFGWNTIMPQTVISRIADSSSNEYLCESYSTIIFPKAGLNEDFRWVFVVNRTGFKQGVIVELCKNPGSICGESVGFGYPRNVQAVCEQNYIYRTLLNYSNGTEVKDTFRLPSCCKCALRYTDRK